MASDAERLARNLPAGSLHRVVAPPPEIEAAREMIDLEQPARSALPWRHGYIRIPKRLNFIGKALDPYYAGEWLVRDAWEFRLGDLEFF